MTPHPRRCLPWNRSLRVVISAACLLAMLVVAHPASASRPTHSTKGRHSSSPRAASARLLPPRLRVAAKRTAQADRALVATARTLRRCLRAHPRRPKVCRASRRALQRAGRGLAHAEGLLSTVARQTGTAAASGSSAPSSIANGSTALDPRMAPQITVSGHTLSWNRVDGFDIYVLVRKVAGQPDQYSLVTGTSVTPPPVPAATVRYSVRTAVLWSAWATEVSIAYPPVVEKAEEPNTQAAPALSASGQTLTWNRVGNVNTYVLIAKAQGRADQYSVLSGTSTTPAAVPGVTVRYSIRTASPGSAWAPEVSISYPALETPPPPSVFQTGLNSGTEPVDLSATNTLGAKLVRLAFAIGAPASQLESAVSKYAAQGVRVLPMTDFSGRIPTTAEAQNLASWARAYGPGGTFWAGRSDASLAMRSIEFGNETSYSYQYSDNSPSGYAARAQAYAVRFAEAATAIRASNAGVGLLAQGDSGNAGTVWIENLFKAVPSFGQLVGGWTIHPYGPTWRGRVEALIRETAAQGAPSTIPIDITEWGLSTDNGQCLTENYGWQVCMTYQAAAEVMTRSVGEMRQALAGRPGMLMLYQIRDQQAHAATNNREAYFGVLQHELQSKGAYTEAVQSVLRS